jgi:hypothetical protein
VNIALGALILVLLILPTISFRFAINRNPILKELVDTISIPDSFWAFLFIPLLIHTAGIFIAHFLFAEIRFSLLYQLIIGRPDIALTDGEFHKYILEFCLYSIFCFGGGYCLGLLISGLEGTHNAFLKHFALSGLLGMQNNKWYRLLDSGSADAREIKNNIEFVFVDILLATRDSNILYSGILKNYYFQPQSKELGHIVLGGGTVRRELRKEHNGNLEAEVTNTFFAREIIPSDLFIIPAKDIININIFYVARSPKT